MVLHSLSKSKTPRPPLSSKPSSMASTFSAKSQPPHNFALSKLKWPMSQRLRRTPDPTHSANDHSENRLVSPMKSPHHHHCSSTKHGDSGKSPNEIRPGSSSLGKIEYGHIRFSCSTTNSTRSGDSGSGCVEKQEKSVTTSSIPSSEKKLGDFNGVADSKEDILKNSDGTSKIFIRIPARNKVAAEANDTVKETQCGVEDEEPVAKTWNLRPRRAVTKPPNSNVNGGAPESGTAPVQSHLEAAAAREGYEENVVRKRKKFSASLTKEEIEEDFLLMTGSRPPKRPKKRSRIVQRQLDGLFPGLWLASVTPDLYRVPDARLKGWITSMLVYWRRI